EAFAPRDGSIARVALFGGRQVAGGGDDAEAAGLDRRAFGAHRVDSAGLDAPQRSFAGLIHVRVGQRPALEMRYGADVVTGVERETRKIPGHHGTLLPRASAADWSAGSSPPSIPNGR